MSSADDGAEISKVAAVPTVAAELPTGAPVNATSATSATSANSEDPDQLTPVMIAELREFKFRAQMRALEKAEEAKVRAFDTEEELKEKQRVAASKLVDHQLQLKIDYENEAAAKWMAVLKLSTDGASCSCHVQAKLHQVWKDRYSLV
jgi:hypothetical protein